MRDNCATLYARQILKSILVLIALSAENPLAAQDPSPKRGNDEPVFQERYPRYRLRTGDVMELTFPFTTEFNQTVTVQPDGFINLLTVGDVRVQDKTTTEVVAIVRAAYNKVLHEPTINVRLTQFEKPYIVMGGEVAKPGKYDYTGDTTIIEAVNIAGGFTDKAKRGEVLLFRRVSDKWAEVKKIDIQRMLKKQDLTEDLHLRPGDMVLVSKSPMSKIERFIPVPTVGTYFSPVVH
jgi:protein involved in polysaccharide export with SLBB domain